MAAQASRVAWVVVVLGVGLLAQGPAAGQSLGELAKKEEARRKALPGSSKVLTNKDLPPVPAKPPGAGGATEGQGMAVGVGAAAPGVAAAGAAPAGRGSAAAAAGVPAAGQAGASEEPADPKKDEQYWRQRITEARQKVARNEILIAALESRINALMTEFVSRDDPAQKAVIAQNRQKALDELNRTRAETERLKREIADIEEEARKAGVPPGWLR